jgi:malate synthase
MDGILRYSPHPDAHRVLTPEAAEFLARLHHDFEPERRALLAARMERQQRFDAGERPGFLPQTAALRSGDWRVRPAPPGLVDRRVEITGPVDRKMMINALNSGARVFMADFEDAFSPTWENVLAGQINLRDAVRGILELETADRVYRVGEHPATLVVRPRGWHLTEKHCTVDGDDKGFTVGGERVSAALFDAGLYLFHNAHETLARGFGPYLYLPKLENHREARLWREVLVAIEDALGLQRGSIRVTVLIETITAAFEMEEILYELRDHICGLNAGRWDYIFSVAKRFHADPRFVLPDRARVTMTVPFMRSYTELLVSTCHRRGAHAIGGMAAFIPNRRKPDVTRAAIERVADDKRREAGDGFDGTWVAHPDLVPTAMAEFDAVLGERPHQLNRQPSEVAVDAENLLTVDRPGDGITRAGLVTNVSVGLRYLASWLGGDGAAAIDDLMEDAATAEISRAQVWQWVHHGARMLDGGGAKLPITADAVRSLLDEHEARLAADGWDGALVARARGLFEEVALAADFPPFLTLPAYEVLPERARNGAGMSEKVVAVGARR